MSFPSCDGFHLIEPCEVERYYLSSETDLLQLSNVYVETTQSPPYHLMPNTIAPHCSHCSAPFSYGFAYHLYLDGTIEGNVKLTGALSTGAFSVGEFRIDTAADTTD